MVANCNFFCSFLCITLYTLTEHYIRCIILVVLYAIGLGIFLDQQQDFAGYYSLDGYPHSGCLSYGFGIALSAFIINIIATVLGLLAICYKKICPSKYKYTINYKRD